MRAAGRKEAKKIEGIGASERCTDASSKRGVAINTNRRRPCCHSSVGRRRHCSGRQNAQSCCHTTDRNTNTSGNSPYWACSTRSDNNRCHTLRRKALLHIPPGKLPRRLRIESTAVYLVFSSDTPFLNSEFPFLFREIADAIFV